MLDGLAADGGGNLRCAGVGCDERQTLSFEGLIPLL